MATIAQLNVNLAANTANFTKGMQKAQNDVKAFQATVGGIGKALGVFSAAAAVAAVGKGFADEIIESDHAFRQLEASIAAGAGKIGLSAEEIKKFASARTELSRFDDDVTIAAAGVLATFDNLSGDRFKKALVAAQDLSATFGTELSDSAMKLGKALQDPANSAKVLRSMGIALSDSQKKLIADFTDLNEVAKAQDIIFGELGKKFGGKAAADVDTLAGSIERFKNSFWNLGSNINASPLITGLQGYTALLDELNVDNIKNRNTDIKSPFPPFFQAPPTLTRSQVLERSGLGRLGKRIPSLDVGPNDEAIKELRDFPNSLQPAFESFIAGKRQTLDFGGKVGNFKDTAADRARAKALLGAARGELGVFKTPANQKSALDFFGAAIGGNGGRFGGFGGTPFAQLGPLAFAEQQKRSVFQAGGTLESGSREALSALARFKTSADDIPKQSLEVQKKTLDAIEDQNKNTQRLEIASVA